MKTKILAISGKKQAGKDTTANYIVGLWVQALGLCEEAYVNIDGKLVLINGQDSVFFDIDKKGPLYEEIKGFIRVYSFADCLKEKVCIDILGLSREQCYGTDEQKNTPTHLKWEDMPGVICDKGLVDQLNLQSWWDEDVNNLYSIAHYLTYHEPGFMTGREVMQFVGTEIFRKMYGDVWVNATINQINKDNPVIAIIRDTRFPNEVEGVQNAGGLVGRLTKDVFKGQDQHESETVLDSYGGKYDFLWDNESLTIEEQCKLIHSTLSDAQLIPHSVTELYI